VQHDTTTRTRQTTAVGREILNPRAAQRFWQWTEAKSSCLLAAPDESISSSVANVSPSAANYFPADPPSFRHKKRNFAIGKRNLHFVPTARSWPSLRQ